MKGEKTQVIEYTLTLKREEAEWLTSFCETGHLGSGLNKRRRRTLIDTLMDLLDEKENK